MVSPPPRVTGENRRTLRSVRGGRGGPQDAAVLSVRSDSGHRQQDGVTQPTSTNQRQCGRAEVSGRRERQRRAMRPTQS